MPKSVNWDMQMTTYDMAYLESLVEAYNPVHALEIGSWKGLSTSILARHCQVVYCVDTWQGSPIEKDMVEEAFKEDIFDTFRHNLNNLGTFNVVKPMMMSSDEAKLIFKDDHLDFIYVDGCHSYEQVKKDLEWFDKLKFGGVMAGHDFDKGHEDVMRAVKEKFTSYQVGVNSSIWSVRKGQSDD